jgi:phage/plasmid-associated DNA primase
MNKYLEKRSELLPTGLMLQKNISSIIKLHEHPPRNIMYDILFQHSDSLDVAIKDKMTFAFHNTVKIQLEKYMLIQDPSNNRITVEYIKPSCGWGRYFPRDCKGLSMIKKEVRNALIKELYYDFDLVNSCQMIVYLSVVMYELTSELNITELSYYCLNRESYLEEIIESFKIVGSNKRDVAKDLMIRLSNMGELPYWLSDKDNKKCIKNPKGTPELMDRLEVYSSEILRIALFLKDINKDGNIYEDTTRLKKSNESKLRSFFSSYVYEIESRIMQVLIKYLTTTSLLIDKDGIFESDGIKLRCDRVDSYIGEYGQGLTGVINLLNAKTKELTNYELTFKNKAMDICYDVIETEESKLKVEKDIIEFTNKEDKTKVNGVRNDLDCAIKILKIYPHWVTCESNLYVFDSKTGLWDKEHLTHIRIIQTLEKELFIIGYKPDDSEYLTKKSYGSCTSLQNAALTQLKSLNINNNWLNQVDSSSHYKLLFKDGYYDMKTGIFYNEFNPEIVFFGRINYNFPYKNGLNNITESQKDYITSVKNRIYRDALDGTMGDFMIRKLSMALAVDKTQHMIFGLGETSAGKSVMMNATRAATDEYSDTFNAQNLVYNINSSQDEGQKMRWAMILRHKRIIFASEIGANDVIDGNQIKKLTGDESVTGRLHCGNETSFLPHFMMFGFFNDLKAIAPMDAAVNRRLLIFNYTKTYVENPIHDFELQADDNIKHEIYTKECKEAILWILLNDYLEYTQLSRRLEIPEEILKSKEVWFPTNDTNIIQAFENNFQITDNVNDYITARELAQWKIDNGFTSISAVAFSNELKKHCKIKKYRNVFTKDKKVSGKSQACWIGIKSLDDTQN